MIFYNGKEDIPDKILKLSDSFSKNAELSDVEVNVRLININLGNNKELLESCRPLKEYSWFVDGVRNKKDQGKLTLEEAVDRTIDEMPEDFQIREFLIGNRAEVKNMCLTEYNEAETMQLFKEEGRAEMIKDMLKRGKTVEEIADFCDYPYEKVREISDRLNATEGR